MKTTILYGLHRIMLYMYFVTSADPEKPFSALPTRGYRLAVQVVATGYTVIVISTRSQRK